MKKPALVLLTLAAVVGALYLRSLASWRPQKIFADKNWEASQLLFSRDGKTLVAVQVPYMQQYSGKVWRARVLALDADSNFVPRWASNTHLIHGGKAQFFADDSYLLAGGRSGLIFDVRTGKNGKLPPTPGKSVISPDRQWLVLTDTQNPGRLSIHPAPQLISGAQIDDAVKVLGTSSQSTDALDFAFSPDSATLAVGVGNSNGTHLELYDTHTWKLTATWFDKFFSAGLPVYDMVQWSSNGQYLFSSWRKTLTGQTGTGLWRATDGHRLTDSQSPVTSADNSPAQIDDQGRPLIVSPYDVRRDEVTVPRSEILFRSPKGEIRSAAISPDGSSLIVATMSGELWKQRLQ